jgi:mRNA-degrading endonuclease RelE of RelBE toxin-antitoxin system
MPEHLARDAVEMILALAEDPYPPHALAMSDSLHGRYRMRVNGWRVIYLVHEQDRLVVIVAVRPRTRNTYLNVP